MSFALRALLLLASVVPVFAATAFQPSWWQIALAAMVGSALGQVAVRATRGRRIAQWSVAVVAVIVFGVGASWTLRRGAPVDDESGTTLLVVRSSAGGSSSLTWDDVRAIQTTIPSVELAVPYLHKAVMLASGDQNWNTQVVGTTPDYFDLMGLHLATGDRFGTSASDKVVVLGDTVVARLYGAGKSPVGEVVRLRSLPFTIVGVLAHRGTSSGGQDLDDVALVPVEVYGAKIDVMPGFRGAVFVSARSRDELARVEAEVRSLLRDRHRLGPGDDDDFMLRTSNPE